VAALDTRHEAGLPVTVHRRLTAGTRRCWSGWAWVASDGVSSTARGGLLGPRISPNPPLLDTARKQGVGQDATYPQNTALSQGVSRYFVAGPSPTSSHGRPRTCSRSPPVRPLPGRMPPSTAYRRIPYISHFRAALGMQGGYRTPTGPDPLPGYARPSWARARGGGRHTLTSPAHQLRGQPCVTMNPLGGREADRVASPWFNPQKRKRQLIHT